MTNPADIPGAQHQPKLPWCEQFKFTIEEIRETESTDPPFGYWGLRIEHMLLDPWMQWLTFHGWEFRGDDARWWTNEDGVELPHDEFDRLDAEFKQIVLKEYVLGGKLPKRKEIPRSLRLAVLERDAYRCKMCDDHKDLTVDHIIPVAAGGTNEPDNMQTLCRRCNTSKGTRIL